MVLDLKDIARGEGDLTRRLPQNSKDEMGELANWFNAFMAKLQDLIKDIAGEVKTVSSSATGLSTISEQMNQGLGGVSDRSGTVSLATEGMSTNMNGIAAAMEQSAANVNMMATSSEELSATISEIAGNTEKAHGISNDAATKAKSASAKMEQLGRAAGDIGKVVDTITDISDQVNLLALNATIEAARAGDAGRGFTVVAKEIKDLAQQTASASQDIKEKVDGVQGTTEASISQISDITRVIAEVNDVVATIAAAVEEQSSATREIADNVSQVSSGIQEVNESVNQSSSVADNISRDLSDINSAIKDMSEGSGQINLSSQELSRLSDKLSRMVGQFRI